MRAGCQINRREVAQHKLLAMKVAKVAIKDFDLCFNIGTAVSRILVSTACDPSNHLFPSLHLIPP